jgi:hypothetical protein
MASKHSQLPDVNTPHTAGDLATNSVTTDKITDLNVTGGKLAANTVTYDKLHVLAAHVGCYEISLFDACVYGSAV